MSNPTVKALLREALVAQGYDGLCNIDGECGCVLEDLFPCGEPFPECRAGYKVACDCGECKWHVATLRVSERCRRDHIQCCDHCDDLECCDNEQAVR